MKVLLLTTYFPPEVGAASHLFFELAETLVHRGHEVSVVTGYPGYNVGSKQIAQYKRGLLMSEFVAGIRVLRIRAPRLPHHIPVFRGMDHFVRPAALLLRALMLERHDVVLVYSPPLPIGLSAYILSRFKGMPSVVNVQDLFPKEAVVTGLLKSKMLIRLFETIERFIYRTADALTVHSPGNREHLLSGGAPAERVRVIPNWVDVDMFRPGDRMNSFRRDHGLNSEFVVCFAGTMGYLQDMDVILEAASSLREHQDIVFLLVGDGVRRQSTVVRAATLGLSNVRFLPMQPRNVYPLVLQGADVCLVTLQAQLTTPVVPSKLATILAAGRPVVASMPLDGDAPKIIEEAGCGFCVPAGDARGLAGAILKLYRDPALREEMGARGRAYAERHFSREGCIGQYEKLFSELVRA
ncbi:MAG: glycosyltransferase family 4 protein [Bacillota bacterium]